MKKISKKSAPNSSITTGTAMTSLVKGKSGTNDLGGLTSSSTRGQNLNNTKYEMGQSYSFSPKKSGATTSKSSAMKYEVGQLPSVSPQKKSVSSQLNSTKNEIGSFVSTTGNKPENLYQSKYEIGKVGTKQISSSPQVSTQSSKYEIGNIGSSGMKNQTAKMTNQSKFEIGKMGTSPSLGQKQLNSQAKYEIGNMGSISTTSRLAKGKSIGSVQAKKYEIGNTDGSMSKSKTTTTTTTTKPSR